MATDFLVKLILSGHDVFLLEDEETFGGGRLNEGYGDGTGDGQGNGGAYGRSSGEGDYFSSNGFAKSSLDRGGNGYGASLGSGVVARGPSTEPKRRHMATELLVELILSGHDVFLLEEEHTRGAGIGVGEGVGRGTGLGEGHGWGWGEGREQGADGLVDTRDPGVVSRAVPERKEEYGYQLPR